MRHLLLCTLLLAGCDSSPSTTQPASEAKTAKTTGKVQKASPSGQSAAETTTGGGPQLPGYKGIYSNDPKLTPGRVASWTPSQHRIKRNEIYARYGRAFKSADLQKHFGTQSWYQVRNGYTDALLTANDKANAALIKSFEGDSPKRDGQYGQLMFMSDHELVISDDSSMYGHEGEERYYVGRGPNRVITWHGAAKLDLRNASVKDPELWSWKNGSWTRSAIPLPNG
jgi:hypothetical protein